MVGITKFCVHPKEWFKNKTRIGGTKNIDFAAIKALKPDLIIGNKEENEQKQMEALMQHYPVWMSDVRTLEQALTMIQQIGELTNKQHSALQLVSKIRHEFEKLIPLQNRTAAYLIWKKPYLCAGSDTFIMAMMQHCGLKNCFPKMGRYPEISSAQLQNAQPEIILLSSEPFPFKEVDRLEFQQICPNAKVMLVDGEQFSWYGSRLTQSPSYFSNLFTAL